MKTQNMRFFVLALCLAVCVERCWGDVVEDAKAKATEAKDAATPAVNAAMDSTAQAANAAKDAAAPSVNAAKDAAAPAANAAAEKSESFAQWAYDKISSGFGLKSEEEKPLAQNAKFETAAEFENAPAPSPMAEAGAKVAESFDKVGEAAKKSVSGETQSK